MSEYTQKYNPNRSSEWNYGGAKWKLSRSKIDFFIECPRCFYLDNKLGTKRPNWPAFNLNIAVDELLKKEFDTYRLTQTHHPIQTQYKIDAVPYQNQALDTWRDPFVGITYLDPKTNLLVSGGVDDVWVDPQGQLIIVDYKATSKDGKIGSIGDSPWEKQYIRQLSVYSWLLQNNNFTVSDTGYLVYANADKALNEFNNNLRFETTLIPIQIDTTWVESTLATIKDLLESNQLPEIGPVCEYCPYREAAGKKIKEVFLANK